MRKLLSILFVILCMACNDDDAVTLYKATVSVEAEGGSFTLYVTSDADIKPVYPDWVNLDETFSGRGQYAFTFSVPAYYSKEGRKGDIYFGGSQRSTTVIQKKMSAYVPSEDMSGFDLADVQIKVIDGWCKYGTNGKGFEDTKGDDVKKMWDGIKGTGNNMCNSPWGAQWFDNKKGEALTEAKKALFPHELKFTLEQGADRVDYMLYYPRPTGDGVFGIITEVLVSTYDNPDQFETVATNYDCEMGYQMHRINFSKPIRNPHTVWVKIGSAKGDFISCTEMEFFGKSSDVFDASTLFKDELCTALKEGVTLEEIEACAYPFFKNIALYMYYDCYETDYRVAEFKAWEHPNKSAARNKTTTYSLLDNPTGIYVEKDETLVTMVGDMHNQSISLRVVNLDTPGADGFDNKKEYTLSPGVNMHKMEQKGLVYVMYHTDAFATAEPVKIHFASGKVNGYFDLYDEKHNKPEEWTELLNNTSSPYLDVLGKYAHLTFPVANLKSVADPVEWVNFYDNLVYEEQKFLGLEKYDRMFKNRMYFNVMYTSYMYSTSYRTSYNVSTMGDLCSLEKLKGDCWGPAHEVGHSNQTRPGLKWTGMTEVTNNILSMYMQRINSGDSRLEIKGYYPHAMTTAFSGRPHITVGKIDKEVKNDVFCQLVPFWQLQLYMAYVLGKDEFYADTYEEVRKTSAADDKAKNAGEHQLEFTYIASQVAKLDLTEFFEKWGFLRTVDTEITDYDTKGVFKIDDAKLNAMKQRIAGLGLPKPQHNFWYITEKTESIFKQNLPMNTNGAKVEVDRDKDAITVTGCSNAVAFEVYDKETGKLIYVSPAESNFVLDKNVFMPKKVEVRAVPASGEAKTLLSE